MLDGGWLSLYLALAGQLLTYAAGRRVPLQYLDSAQGTSYCPATTLRKVRHFADINNFA